MASRPDRKHHERAERRLRRALERRDALELLELAGQSASTLDPATVAGALAHDVVASVRRKDAARLFHLANAYAKHAPDLDVLEREDAAACRWTLLGVCLTRGLLAPARALADGLRPILRERAPALAVWIDAALAHGGHVPRAAAADLPSLVDPAAPPSVWAFPERLETVEALRDAVLAGSVLLPPRVLAERITRHLEHTKPEARSEHAAAARPAIVLRAIEAADAGEREALRIFLDLLAVLQLQHANVDDVGSTLRLARSLDASTNAEDLRYLARVLGVAWRDPATRPAAVAAFVALRPTPKLQRATLAVAEQLLAAAPFAELWGRAFELWHERAREDEAPPWLERSYSTLVDSGELARWLGTQEDRRRRQLLDQLDAFSSKPFLTLAEQLWDQLSAFDRPGLAQMVAHCLTVPEDPRAEMRGKTTRMTMGQLHRQLARQLTAMGEQAPPMLHDLVDELATAPPRMPAPPQLVAMAELLASMSGEHIVLGPRQRAFLARVGLRMVPDSLELLHIALHDPEHLRDGGVWIDAHLGDAPSNEALVRVADMVWGHQWTGLVAHVERRLEARAERSVADLAELLRTIDDLDGPRELLQRFALRLLQAHERGEPGIDRFALVIARRHAPKPAKKKTAKQASAKKKAAKKASSKKPSSKKSAP